MNTNQEAAQSLAKRALEAATQSEAELLAAAAQKLDQTIQAKVIIHKWLNNWMEENQDRNQVQS